jgi:uncharacterized protein
VILPDVNTLVYAFRRDSRDHPRYNHWLGTVVNGESTYGIAPQVLSSVVRLATNPRVFKQPSDLEDALRFCRTLLEQPQCEVIQPGRHHWSIFANLCRAAQATGNLVQDAWFAALAIEHGCDWITTDRDFARFPGLHWRTAF